MTTSLRSVHVWTRLAWQEVRQRYRRSMLGPFWLTINTGALLVGMGPLYGRLLGQEFASYFPHLAIGLVLWQLMASIINDSTHVFIAAEPLIKQVQLPLGIHVLRMIWRNAILFAHNAVIVAAVLALYGPGFRWTILLSVFGIAAILVNALWLGTLLGLLSARFRDFPLITTMLVQLGFFLTPVLWTRGQLGPYEWVVRLNPLAHFLEVVRTPLLGTVPPALSWAVVAGVTVAGSAVSLLLFARYRWRIAYWL
jgi:ABC-type polysaccharide/polyol phosphate export permease